MRNLRILFGTVFFCLIIGHIYGQKIAYPPFTVRVDPSADPNLRVDSIVVKIIPDYSIGSDDWASYVLKPGLNGIFIMKEKLTTPGRVIFYPRHSGKAHPLFNSSYFFEPGDQITINLIPRLTQDSATFSGKGSAKYNIVTLLRNMSEKFREQWTSLKLYQAENLKSELEKVIENHRIFEQEKEELIDNFGFTDKMRKKISLEYGCFNERWDLFIGQLFGTNFKNDENTRSLVKKLYEQNKTEFQYPPEEDFTADCRNYILVSLEREYLLQLLRNGHNSPPLSASYEAIKKGHCGPVAEAMISELLLSPTFIGSYSYTQGTLDSLTLDAEKLAIIPSYKQQFFDAIQLGKGKKIFPSKFTSLNDQPITFDSLKGKVVFVDMWGIGCSACAIFHKRFEQDIYPKFKNNDKFIVLSIYDGRDKKNWIKGIESKNYTSTAYLNVSVHPLSVNHPFLKHYRIDAAPFLLLIDSEGNIVTQINGGMDSNRIVNLISAALNQ